MEIPGDEIWFWLQRGGGGMPVHVALGSEHVPQIEVAERCEDVAGAVHHGKEVGL